MLYSRARSSRKTLKWIIVVAAIAIFAYGLSNNSLHSIHPARNPPEEHFLPVLRPVVERPKPILPKKKDVAPEQKLLNKPLGEHTYRSDGLLELNEDGAHPIFELMDNAQKEWDDKLKRASKTLEEAVAEYRRRYRRAPPKGFDLWWKYAMKHNVQLPDEYDQIHNDMEAFWGIEPKDLHAIQADLETKKDTFTLGKTNPSDKISVLGYSFQEGRYDQLIAGTPKILALLNEIHEYLPPFRATFSPHDGPNRLTDYGVKYASLQAALAQTYLERDALPNIEAIGWVSACSPKSPARLQPINLDQPPARPTKKTFIYDHVTSMDPCVHPEHLFHHGQFLSHNMGPTPQPVMVPEFTQCSTTIHHNIRIPSPYGWVEDVHRPDDPEWADKPDERLLWRGRNTGMMHDKNSRWHHAQRDYLVLYANEINGTTKILPPSLDKHHKLEKMVEIRTARLNPAVMDVAFAGEPIACTPEICDYLLQIYPWRPYQPQKESGKYKYVIDVDGNGWSGRFKRLMTTNALVFKSTIYPEWYADRVAPWLHYVPIQLDLSDLHDALLFFRGDPNGNGAHEDLGEKIAMAGREWSKTFWRKEDMVAYFFRLLLEYIRLMSVDREAMSYTGTGAADNLEAMDD